jgi:hypothetical protein
MTQSVLRQILLAELDVRLSLVAGPVMGHTLTDSSFMQLLRHGWCNEHHRTNNRNAERDEERTHDEC